MKGAYWDYETIKARANGWPVPVFQKKWQSDANFERCTRFVLQTRPHLRPALGSHNIRSLAHGIAAAQVLELPPAALELQMLYGMADAEKQALVERGQRLRIYMPYGDLIPGMAYLVRRLLENTSNDSFLRAGFVEHVSPDDSACESRGRYGATTLACHHALRQTRMSVPRGRRWRSLSPTNRPFDFAVPENREAMQAALADVREQFGRHYPLVHRRPATSIRAEIGESTNPADKSRAHRHATRWPVASTPSAAVRGMAKAALSAWATLRVERASGLPAPRGRAHARAAVRAGGLGGVRVRQAVARGRRPMSMRRSTFASSMPREAIRIAIAKQGVDVPGEENRFDYLPRGVVGVIAPWNFPLAILTGMSVAALATGNTVVMKPAEQSAVVAAKLMDVFREVGLPAGVLNYLPGHGEVAGAALVEHPDVALIAFTGSRAVGLAINAKAAEVSQKGLVNVKRVIAEMGGKNAIIVDADADLDEAVSGVVKSAFGYQGQKCSACSRVRL